MTADPIIAQMGSLMGYPVINIHHVTGSIICINMGKPIIVQRNHGGPLQIGSITFTIQYCLWDFCGPDDEIIINDEGISLQNHEHHFSILQGKILQKIAQPASDKLRLIFDDGFYIDLVGHPDFYELEDDMFMIHSSHDKTLCYSLANGYYLAK